MYLLSTYWYSGGKRRVAAMKNEIAVAFGQCIRTLASYVRQVTVMPALKAYYALALLTRALYARLLIHIIDPQYNHYKPIKSLPKCTFRKLTLDHLKINMGHQRKKSLWRKSRTYQKYMYCNRVASVNLQLNKYPYVGDRPTRHCSAVRACNVDYKYHLRRVELTLKTIRCLSSASIHGYYYNNVKCLTLR